MAYDEWLFRSSAPIMAASAAAGLSGKDAETANAYAMLVAKHKQLSHMPAEEGTKAYDQLDKKLQKALSAYFGETKYIPKKEEDQSFLGNVWENFKAPIVGAMDILTGYSEGLSNIYRSARTAEDIGDFFSMDNWNDAWDGNKLFDPELEAQIENAYSPEIIKIARKYSIGKTTGEIMASMRGDKEWDAFIKFTKQDSEIMNAVRDYGDARISWGRDFARMFGLQPDIGAKDQGVEGTAYQWISGAADLAGDLAFDPLTYLAWPLSAINRARFGVTALINAERAASAVATLGDLSQLTKTQKLFSTFGKTQTWENAFNVSSVRKAFDEAGGFLDTINTSKSAAVRNKARVELGARYSFFDDITISELAKAGVKDADTALSFFQKGEAVENILKGSTGELTKHLPRHKATTAVRLGINQAARNVFGYSKNAAKFDPIADTTIGLLEKGESIAKVAGTNSPVAGLKDLSSVRGVAGRMFERAFMNRSVYIGGEDVLGRSLKWQSTGTVYTLARSVLPKYQAKQIAAAFGAARDEATTRNLLNGLLKTVADSLGLDRTGVHKEAFEKIMKSWGTPMYGEKVAIGDDLKHLFNNADSINPAEINGTQMATSANQLAQQTVIPNIKEFVDLLNKKPFLQGVSNTVNNRYVQGVTDAWSAVNLLPRLGLRSVVDENIFHALTIPLSVIPNAIRGYRVSVTKRMVSTEQKLWKPYLSKIGEAKDPVTGEIKSIRQLNAIDFGGRDVGVFARLASKWLVNATDEELKLGLKGADAQRDLLQTQLTRGKFLGGLNDTDAEFIGDLGRFGGFDEVRDFSHGMNAAISNGSMGPTKLNVPYENYNPNIQAMLKDLGEAFGGAPVPIRSVDASFSVNFIFQVNARVDRGGVPGKIAVRYMDKPDKAIAEIEDYLLAKGKYKGRGGDKFLTRFERSAHESVTETAKRMYLHVRSVFQNDVGELNTKLLDKVRKVNPQTKKLEISAMDLGPDDLEDIKDMLPMELMGYKTEMPSFSNVGGLFAALMDKGFQVADRQVATLSREPAYYGYYLHYRRELKGAQDAFLKKQIDAGMDAETAALVTKERYDFIGRELAMNRVVGFVDNPNVRSNFAYGMRNMARYYRANEDFARRALRAAGPEEFIRLRMANEGLDEAGFIHEDENGDKYFFIPVDQITYNVYAPIVEYFSGTRPMQPMPMTLTGKIKMLSPSLDPESSLPTFSGPLMALSWQAVKNFVPLEWRNEGEKVMFGPYAENRNLADALIPSGLRKMNEVATATFIGPDSAQIQSAAMKAAAYYTANGMAPGPDATIREREEFKLQVQSTARNIVAVRNLLGIFSPVSPTLTTSRDVPDYLLNEGTTSFKTMFNDLVAAEYKKGTPNAYSVALNKWTKRFPGRLVYTVSETETNKVAAVQKTKQAVNWMKQNQGIVRGYPQGSMFLAPQIPGFDMSSYAFLKAEGIVEYKPLEQYFEEIANIRAETEYRKMKSEAEGNIANAKLDSQRSWLIDKWETQRENYLKGKPYLKLKFEQSSGTQIKRDALEDLRSLLDSGSADGLYGTKVLRKMIREFDSVDSSLNSVKSTTNAAAEWRSRVKQDALNRINAIAGSNPNAQLFYKEIIEGLIG